MPGKWPKAGVLNTTSSRACGARTGHTHGTRPSHSSRRHRNPRRWQIRRADCVQALPKLAADSIDAIVTDPPYGLEFMGKKCDRLGDVGQASPVGFSDAPGKRLASYAVSANLKCQRFGRWKWDKPERRCNCGTGAIWPNVRAVEGRGMQEWHHAWAREALRVLKPGGHLLAFGGIRTFHRLTCALEDAGFEIRDCLCRLYGTGFPKSLNVAAAIDKMSSKAAAAWQGWGTALKPAWEPIVLDRKPLGGTTAQNVCRHSTGALNIDGRRIAFQSDTDAAESKTKNRHADFNSGTRKNRINGRDERTRRNYDAPGRWPTNLILSHAEDCRRTGHTHIRSDGHHPATRGKGGFGTTGHSGQQGLAERSSDQELIGSWECSPDCAVRKLDEHGGAVSRFFYCAKASTSERDAGTDGLPTSLIGTWGGEENDLSEGKQPTRPYANTHPTVKPIALMRHLVRLITPPGGTVLDPFTGSGSTGAAASWRAHAPSVSSATRTTPRSRGRASGTGRVSQRAGAGRAAASPKLL
jgi:DNA modification methylase